MDNEPNIIIYNAVDGKSSVALYAHDGKIWLNQQQIADLFATSKPNISMHISNILRDNEMSEDSVVQNYLTTAADGKQYNVVFYSLEMILTIGYWRNNVDALLVFQGKDVLKGNGTISNLQMETWVKGVYELFDANRKHYEARLADQMD